MHFSIDRTVHTTAFDKPVVDHWLEQKIAQTAAGSTEKDRSDDRPLQRLSTELHPAPFYIKGLDQNNSENSSYLHQCKQYSYTCHGHSVLVGLAGIYKQLSLWKQEILC